MSPLSWCVKAKKQKKALMNTFNELLLKMKEDYSKGTNTMGFYSRRERLGSIPSTTGYVEVYSQGVRWG